MQTRPWFPVAVFVGLVYALVGILFALPPAHVKLWRLAAWVVSAFFFAAHISYENFRVRNPPPVAALHVASAVALGAFGLAVAANIHSLRVGDSSQHRGLLIIALAAWPAITALPACMVAWVASAALTRASRKAD